MGGNIVILVLLMLLPLVDSSRPWKMLTMNLGGEANLLYSWAIFSSGVFVFFASVLSVFLIIQHLAVYKQPEYADGLVRHPFPLNCFMKNWYLGPDFYESVKIGIVQYMILKAVCALLAIIFKLLGVYGEGQFKWKYGITLGQGIHSAIYVCATLQHKLEPIKPLAKFLVFKSIVFLTWWQGVAIAFLSSTGTLKGHLAQQLKTRIQDYIICIEMGIAAVVHLYVFPAKPYCQGERCVRNVAVMTDYASLGTPPDPEEVEDCGRSTRVQIALPDDRERLMSFPQRVQDVLFGSGEIVVDDVKLTVSHMVEPVE